MVKSLRAAALGSAELLANLVLCKRARETPVDVSVPENVGEPSGSFNVPANVGQCLPAGRIERLWGFEN